MFILFLYGRGIFRVLSRVINFRMTNNSNCSFSSSCHETTCKHVISTIVSITKILYTYRNSALFEWDLIILTGGNQQVQFQIEILMNDIYLRLFIKAFCKKNAKSRAPFIKYAYVPSCNFKALLFKYIALYENIATKV